MTCAFDESAFDSVTFDTCQTQEVWGGTSNARSNNKVIFIRRLDDDEAILLAYSRLEEII